MPTSSFSRRIAIDGTPQGLQLIRDKALDATVSQPLSAYATKTAELIELVFNGGKIEIGPRDDGQVIDTPVGPQYQLNATLVTSENVDSADLWANHRRDAQYLQDLWFHSCPSRRGFHRHAR